MRAQGHTTVWGTHVGVGRAREHPGVFERLRAWRSSRRLAKRQLALARWEARWDPEREKFRLPSTESALEHVARKAGLSLSMALYNLMF